MASLLTTIGELFTTFIGWAGDVGDMIVGTPILLFSFGIFAVGAAIGLFGRLLHRG